MLGESSVSAEGFLLTALTEEGSVSGESSLSLKCHRGKEGRVLFT